LNPCQDSRSRWSAHSAARTCDLDRDLAGLHNAGAGGMARSVTLHATADVAASCRAIFRGVSARQRRRGPRGPKEGGQRPGASRLPVAVSQLRADVAPPCSLWFPHAALSRCDGQPGSGALEGVGGRDRSRGSGEPREPRCYDRARRGVILRRFADIPAPMRPAAGPQRVWWTRPSVPEL
jgi:hypothetical protein